MDECGGDHANGLSPSGRILFKKVVDVLLKQGLCIDGRFFKGPTACEVPGNRLLGLKLEGVIENVERLRRARNR